MQTKHLIAVDVFCANHQIGVSFLGSLKKNGLIEFVTIEKTNFINASELPQLEKIVRFYYDLDINLEGIETINHLLQKINALQDEIITLKNKLRLNESHK